MNPKLCKQFELQLNNLINNSQLTIVEVYYIVKIALLQLEHLYNQILMEPDNSLEEEGTVQIDIPVVENVPEQEEDINNTINS